MTKNDSALCWYECEPVCGPSTMVWLKSGAPERRRHSRDSSSPGGNSQQRFRSLWQLGVVRNDSTAPSSPGIFLFIFWLSDFKKAVTEELNPWTCECIHPCFYDYINELQVKSLPPVNELLTKKLCLWSELNVCINWFTFNAVLLNKRWVINIFFKLFTSELLFILIKVNVKQNTFFSVVSWHDERVHSKINLRWELYFTQHGSSISTPTRNHF